MYQSAQEAYLESRVLAADPLELVRMLYQGAIGAVQDARHHLAEGKFAERSRSITKAFDILAELNSSLDHALGGEVAGRLASLYEYMQRRLLEANFHQIDPPLGEVLGLLRSLAETWNNIGKAPEPQAPVESPWSQPASPEMPASYAPGSWSL